MKKILIIISILELLFIISLYTKIMAMNTTIDLQTIQIENLETEIHQILNNKDINVFLESTEV